MHLRKRSRKRVIALLVVIDSSRITAPMDADSSLVFMEISHFFVITSVHGRYLSEIMRNALCRKDRIGFFRLRKFCMDSLITKELLSFLSLVVLFHI